MAKERTPDQLDSICPIFSCVTQEMSEYINDPHRDELIQWGSLIPDLGKYESQQLLGQIVEASVRAGKWTGIQLDVPAMRRGNNPVDFVGQVVATEPIQGFDAMTTGTGYTDGITKLVEGGYATLVKQEGKVFLAATLRGAEHAKKALQTYKPYRPENRQRNSLSERRREIEEDVHDAIKNEERRYQSSPLARLNRFLQRANREVRTLFERMTEEYDSDNGTNAVMARIKLEEMFPGESPAFYTSLEQEIRSTIAFRKETQESITDEELRVLTQQYSEARGKYQQLQEQSVYFQEDQEFVASMRLVGTQAILAEKAIGNILHWMEKKDPTIPMGPFEMQYRQTGAQLIRDAIDGITRVYSQYYSDRED